MRLVADLADEDSLLSARLEDEPLEGGTEVLGQRPATVMR